MEAAARAPGPPVFCKAFTTDRIPLRLPCLVPVRYLGSPQRRATPCYQVSLIFLFFRGNRRQTVSRRKCIAHTRSKSETHSQLTMGTTENARVHTPRSVDRSTPAPSCNALYQNFERGFEMLSVSNKSFYVSTDPLYYFSGTTTCHCRRGRHGNLSVTFRLTSSRPSQHMWTQQLPGHIQSWQSSMNAINTPLPECGLRSAPLHWKTLLLFSSKRCNWSGHGLLSTITTRGALAFFPPGLCDCQCGLWECRWTHKRISRRCVTAAVAAAAFAAATFDATAVAAAVTAVVAKSKNSN